MTKRTKKTGGTQAANREAASLGRLLAPRRRDDDTRRQLLAWVQSAGLVALEACFARSRSPGWTQGPPQSDAHVSSRNSGQEPPPMDTQVEVPTLLAETSDLRQGSSFISDIANGNRATSSALDHDSARPSRGA
jgi:hypothetical protein